MADGRGGSGEAPAAGGAEEEEEHSESKERALQRYFLKEWKLVKSILDGIIAGGGAADYASVSKIRSILDKYQQQGQLLEPYLETIISPLMHIILAKTVELGTSSNEILEIMKPLCIVVYTLVTVCGYKTVLKFFPHQVSDLEIAVSLLEKCHDVTAKTILRQESTGEMEMKCVILLWLSVLVLIPFDISSVDTSITTSTNYEGEQEPPPLVLRLLSFSKDYLSSAGPMRRISCLLLSKLLTRPDMPKAFMSFNEWAHEVLSSATVNMEDQFRLLGVVEALAAIFKVGSRKYLLDFVNTVWADASSLVKSPINARSSLLRKFLMKLAQRIGLVCLPHRPMTWHYVGRRSSFCDSTICGSDEDGHMLQSSSLGEEDIDVPEIIEEVIEMLLSGLRDTDTVVRWSAAKGIGRIASRLTSTLCDEVLSSILDLFSPCMGDGSWHGGCLALAELARRGLLLPTSFSKVIPLITKALHYDVRRGPHSIGSHVRDAAAYVCWAFGRAYSYSDMKNVLEQIAPHLLTIACYDREVNCRRAAAAAFQENVGRQGNFPHGIEIVNMADYFSLSSRVNSYLDVAVSIGQYSEYLHLFVEELLCKKICHWDKGLRELAARGLSSISKYDIEYFSSVVLDRLVPCTLSTDLCMRHGATLALGELILALCNLGVIFSTEKQKQVSGVVPAIEKARLYRGKGGEIMRSSVSRLIECTAICSIHLPNKLKANLFNVLNENLKHPTAQIQISAVDALRHFFPAYLLESDLSSREKIVLNYLKLLADPNVAARRGSALAIGVLPFEFLACRWKDVLHKLCCCCLVEDDPNDRDAEARVNAVSGLTSVCKTLTRPREDDYLNLEGRTSLYLSIKNDVFQTLLKTLDDYSVDNRGDVGSWVREAAMGGLESCTYILCDKGFVTCTRGETHLLFDGSLATSLIGGLLKQAVEKMDKTRETAGKILCRILHNPKVPTLSVNHSDTLKEIFANDSNLEWGVPSVSYPRLVNLLQFDCYSKSMISGLVVSTGGLQSSLQKASIGAVLDYLRVSQNKNTEEGEQKELMLSEDLIWVLQQYRKCDRVIIPTLKTIEVLLSKRVFLSMENHCQDFASRILVCLEIEMKGSKEFSKLFTGISILGYLTSVPDPTNMKAFGYLVSFLTHRYPKIRKATADQLYLVLVQNGSLVAEERIGKAFDMLLETCWDGDLEEAKNRTLDLYELVGIDERHVKLTKEKELVNKGGKVKAPTDENESYSALVEASGF